MGWCFPRRDLDILDDPIPDKLYCKKKSSCIDQRDSERGSIEEGTDSAAIVENGGPPPLIKKDTDINMTCEVDRCELWKHMVHKLDKEPSCRVASCKKNLCEKFEQEMDKRKYEPMSTSYKTTEI